MAAPAVAVERFRVEHAEGFTIPVVSLTDRRAAGNRLVRFVFQRHLETVLYGRSEGSSGPIWKVMNAAGIGSTTLVVNKAAVTSGTITEAEYTALMDTFKSALPADVVDPCSLGRIRNCTILPLAAAATVVRTFGRSPASMAWLRALSQPVPQAWELREEQEANNAAGEVDLLLNEKLDDANFEADESSFAAELMTMPAFSADREDEERLKTYILQRVPPGLKRELDIYLLYRTETFAARRAGGAVQSISAEADQTALLRFFGWMAATNRPLVGDSITFMIRDDLGDIAQEYAQWLQNTQRCKFSTIANYINGLVSITSYCYANLGPDDALLAMDPNPLTQLINLRGQAEKASKTQQMYDKRVGGWIEWQDVQKARVSATKKLDEMGRGGAPAAKRNLQRDCCALSLLSLIPPDRVGCIRKLRFGHTLKRKPSGGWAMDLSKQRDGHKTSRFYGPFAASLPSALTPVLDKYEELFKFEMGGDEAYLFHPPQSGFDRPMESSSWSQWVSRLFQRHSGVAIAPKTLRSIFITWLRSNTDAPEILKAAAHAQKHSEARQASDDYDQQADDRLVKAAYDFNIQFASSFTVESAALGAGSSSAAVAEPAEVNAQLADVGFTKSKSKGNGDCYPLSAMAGFEISATAARQPRDGTTASVRQVRKAAVDVLAGNAAVGGIDAAVFRVGECLPVDAEAAREAMAPWLESGFWNGGDGNKSASFMLSVALHLERPVAVIERKGKTFLNPVRIYGARDANGALIRSIAKPHAPETVPTFELAPFADLIETLRTNPISCSVVEFNGSNHFDPWLLRPSLRAAAEAAAEAVAQAAVRTEGEEGGELVVAGEGAASDEAAVDGEAAATTDKDEVEAALVEDEWVRMPGGPWTARLMRKARQPPSTADYRVFGVAVSFDAERFPVNPDGAVKFVNVPGAPVGDIVCDMPSKLRIEGRAHVLMFPLRLSKDGAADDEVTINTVLYRKQVEGGGDADGDGDDHGDDGKAAAGGDDDEDDDEMPAPTPVPSDVVFMPPAPPPPLPAAPQPTPRPQRQRKRKAQYGDNGELDGAASSFRSAPSKRKPSVDPSVEMGIPAFAIPGEQVWAMGLHAGSRRRFKAEVVGLRKQFPRIIVKYTATEDGNTAAIALPEMRTAYVTMADVEPKDW